MNLILVVLCLQLLAGSAIAENGRSDDAKVVYVVNDYRYDPADTGGDRENGHVLCASRCNALSFDYLDYTMAGSWAISKVADGREIVVSLNNPFMGGNCICTVDEYLIRPNNRNIPKRPAAK